MSLARLLAHYDSSDSRHETLVPVEVCRELARQLKAEKISQRLYRMLSPESVFPVQDFPQSSTSNQAAILSAVCTCKIEHRKPKTSPRECPVDQHRLGLAAREIPGCRFMSPNYRRQAAAKRADAIAVLGEYQWA